MLDQLRVKRADFRSWHHHAIGESVAATEIDRGGDQRFIHRKGEMSVSANPPSLTERCIDRFPQADPDILGGVVIIDMQIPFRGDRQVDCRMPREEIEHMIQKADSGLAFSLATSIELQRQLHVGLTCDPVDFSSASHVRPLRTIK